MGDLAAPKDYQGLIKMFDNGHDETFNIHISEKIINRYNLIKYKDDFNEHFDIIWNYSDRILDSSIVACHMRCQIILPLSKFLDRSGSASIGLIWYFLRSSDLSIIVP